MLYFLIGIGYIAFYAAGGWLLRDVPFARVLFGNLGLLVPPLVVCGVIVTRRRRWLGCQRLFWDTFAVGVALWMIGHIGWAFGEIVLGRQSWLQWHTVFSLSAGIGPLVALFARPHRGVRSASVGSVGLVLASYALFSFFIYAYFALVPSVVVSPNEADVTLFRLVQINRAALLVGMLGAAVVARRTPWRQTFAWLALASGIGFIMRILTSQAIVAGNYQSGTVYDLAWIAPFLLYARAALAAPDSTTESFATPDSLTTGRYTAIAGVAIFLIPLIGYGTPFYFDTIGGIVDSFRGLLTGLMTVAGLGLLTLRMAAQQGALDRADARVRLLAAAAEQTGDLILIVRTTGAVDYANDAYLRVTGLSRAELSRQSIDGLLEAGVEGDGSRVRTEVLRRGVWRGTRLRRRSSGSTLPLSGTVVGLKGDDGALTHYVVVERDITDELRLRDQLVHSERLSAVGELVAGVAHEINNPLQTIVGSVELMLQDGARSNRGDLELVRREAARAGHIVRNLLSFVRRSAPSRTVADVNEIVAATLELREYHLQQRNIVVVLELQSTRASVFVNREEIQQIVLNLVLNAEHAILSEDLPGTITIRTRTTDGLRVLEVSDTGPGISAEHRGRIFEPFFSTKDVGQGTGLGLAISHGIASAHGGSLDIQPSAIGACFRLTLPAHEDQAVPAVSSGSRASGTGVALVVDDEEPIRRLIARVLRKDGVEVVEAENAEVALTLARQHSVRVVICDLRMPGMGGAGLYRRLIAQDPSLAGRFLFITGNSAIDAAGQGIADVPVLEKPFTTAALREALASVDPEVRA